MLTETQGIHPWTLNSYLDFIYMMRLARWGESGNTQKINNLTNYGIGALIYTLQLSGRAWIKPEFRCYSFETIFLL